MHVKQLKTRIRKDHEVSLVDQKAWQPGGMLDADAKELTFFQLLRKEALLKHRKQYNRRQDFGLIYKIAIIKYKIFFLKRQHN